MTDENIQKDENSPESLPTLPTGRQAGQAGGVQSPEAEVSTIPEAAAPAVQPTVAAVTPVTDDATPATETVVSETLAETPTETLPALPAQASEEVKNYNDLRPGMTVRVHQKIKETNTKGEEKERVQVYEGMIIARRHGTEIGSTITVRKIASGVGVEKIFPLNSPTIAKIEAVKQAQVRRAKLHYLKSWGKKLKETILKK